MRRIETAITRLPPAAALTVLLRPTLGLVPVKLLALWLLARGAALAETPPIQVGACAGLPGKVAA